MTSPTPDPIDWDNLKSLPRPPKPPPPHQIEPKRLAIMGPADSPPDTLVLSAPEEEPPLQMMPNDSENARQFVGVHGHRFRFFPGLKQWLVWDAAAGWTAGSEAAVMEIGRDYVDAQVDDTRKALKGASESQVEKIMKVAAKFGDINKLRALLSLTACDPKIIVQAHDVDADPWLAGVANGILNLKEGGRFEQASIEVLVTKRLGCGFDPGATCPVWEGFLAMMQPDPEIRAFLQRWSAYCLTGDITEEKWVFCYGHGANGKSTYLETLKSLLGDYGRSASEKLLTMDPRGNNNKAEVAQLPAVRFLLGGEAPEGMRLNENFLKGLASGDSLSGEAKFCPPFDFKPVAKVNLVGNHKPVVSGQDGGFWRKILLVPWLINLTESEKDMSLRARLSAELPGILNWCLEGLADWQNGGLRPPPSILAATAEYKSDSDVLADFLADHIDTSAPGCRLTQTEVYQKFREWAMESGIRSVWAARTLNRNLEDRGFAKGKSHGAKIWKDVGWLSNL